jgi:putative nucleotidyltransferase with HDIG domain
MSIPEKLLDRIERLEPLPITVQKLISLLDDPDADFKEIAKIIEYDGAITSNILRIANSAAFGGRTPISNTQDAVVRLGSTTLLDIMLIGHLRSLRVSAPLYSLSEDDFWIHSAASSLAAKGLIKELRNLKIPQAATVAALIHDIGKLIMVRYLEADVASLADYCAEKEISTVEGERELFECDHAEVGGAMATQWSFPDPIKQAIEQHHNTPKAESDLMLEAVIIANEAAKTVCNGFEADGELKLTEGIASVTKRIKLKPKGFEGICNYTAFGLDSLKQSYGIAT